MPDAFQRDGFGTLGDAAAVLVDLLGQQFHGGGTDLFRLLVQAGDLALFRDPVEVEEGNVVGHAPAVLAEPGEDGAVVGQDHVRFLFLHPGDHAGLVELVADQGFHLGQIGVGGLPGEQAGEPEVIHLGIDKAGHGQAHAAVAAEAGLLQSLKDSVELVVADVVDGHLVEGVAEGDEGKEIPLEAEFHPEGGQGAEDQSPDATVDQNLGKFGSGIPVIPQPVGFNAITQFRGALGDGPVVTGKGEVFPPAVAGGEGGDEGEVADKFGLPGGPEVGHQGADHRVGPVAQLLRHFLDLLAGGGGDPGVFAKSQGDRDLGDPAPFGDFLQGNPHLGDIMGF